jgi:N-dimethylarginine dimethylaminohydrolase
VKLNSYNEWDPLKEVIVGIIKKNPLIPFYKKNPLNKGDIKLIKKISKQVYPDWLVCEAKENLDKLCSILKKFKIKIHRPNDDYINKEFNCITWSALGENVYNARDLNLIVGNNIIESPSQEKTRYFENFGYYKIFYKYFNEGCNWFAGPKPILSGEYLIDSVDEKGNKYQYLLENEILFEAANVVRMGKDLLYLVSRSGNKNGAAWLQNILGDNFRVHTTDKIYRSSHIDSTVMCLRPGHVLLNAERVTSKNCPSIFKKWNKIYFQDIKKIPEKTVLFHQNIRKKMYNKLLERGIYSDINHMSSAWIGMNFLSVNEKIIIIDEYQTNLIKVLEKMKYEIIPISFGHSYFFKGGIHCCTLDTVRSGTLENYF